MTLHAVAMTVANTVGGAGGLMADNEFGVLLRQMRHVANLTQQQLADKAGTTVHTLSKFETGERRPSRSDSKDVVLRIAQAVGDRDGRLLQLAGFTPRPDEKVVRSRPPFRDLILTEPTLTKKQKAILLELYDSWVG